MEIQKKKLHSIINQQKNMLKSLTNLSSQASIHQQCQVFDQHYGNRKKLASFQSYVICIKNKFDPQSNLEGFVNFGTSINTIIPQTTIKYFPQFIKLQDCYYPDPRGYDQFNKKVCEGTKFSWDQTFTLNNIHTIMSILCYKNKRVFVVGNSDKINMKIILDHSKAERVNTKQNADLVIFFDHSKQIIRSCEQQCPKTVIKLFILSSKEQLKQFDVNKDNQAFVYQYAFKEGLSLAALHTKEKKIKRNINDEWFFCATSSITRRASLLPDLKIQMEETGTETIRKMIQIDSKAIVPENNIWLTTGVSSGIDALSRILFDNVTLGVDAPYYFGFNAYFTHHNAKIVSKPILPGSVMIDRIKQSQRQGSTGYIICNPKNPDGTVLAPEELDQICQYVRNKPNFHLVFDEAFWNTCFVRETKSAVSYAVQLPNVHVVRGMAKDFGLGGVKIGFTISSNPLVMKKFEEWKPIISHHPYSVSILNYMLKKSNYGTEIFEVGKQLLRDYFDIVYSELDKENISYLKPDAGCFVYVNLKEFLRENTYDQQCLLWKKLFYKYRVNISNGANFSTPEFGYFRLCPIMEQKTMREGLRRMIAAIRDEQKQFGDLQI